MMAKTAQLLADVEQAYDSFKFNGVYRAVYDFVNDLSSVYMDVTKDRLYSESPDSSRRRAVQTVLFNILEVLVRVLSPILSFTADEVWECYPEAMRNREGRVGNVQLAGWPHRSDFVPALPGKLAEEKVLAAFGNALEVRDVVTKALEDARGAKVINKSQEATVSVTAPPATLDALSAFDASVFEELFIVSGVAFAAGEELACEVKPAEGDKCPRCWNYRELGGNANHPDVCQRCGDALDAIGFTEE